MPLPGRQVKTCWLVCNIINACYRGKKITIFNSSGVYAKERLPDYLPADTIATMSAPVPRIDVSSLSLARNLGTGGQGSVTAVSHFRIAGQWNAVLKTYSRVAAAAMRPAVLEKVIGFPRQLTATDRDWLHEHAAWPAVIAENDGAVCGFLMREVPPAYYFGFRTRTQGTQPKLADLAFLLNPDDYVTGSGLEVSERDRVALLLVLAEALGRLHSLDIVVGDLSPKNLLFSAGSSPSCFFIDCDTMRLAGETVLEQIDTPDWEPPDNEPKGTVATDSYKFGLLAIRLFARDQSSVDPAALTAFSRDLGRLAELSLHGDPARRPGPRQWLSALAAAQSSASLISSWPSQPIVQSTQVSRSPVTVPADPVPDEPGLAATAPTYPVASAAPRTGHPSRPSSRRGSKIALSVALSLAIVAAIIVAVVMKHSTAGPAASADSAAVSGGISESSPARPSAAPSSPSWQLYQQPGLFSIKLPAGWTVSSQTGSAINFTGQPPGFKVLVGWTDHPKPDQYTDWQQQAAGKAQTDPTYRQIAIQRVDYRGYNAAYWEFTNVYQGVRVHVMDQGFIVVPGQLAYAIELYGPADGWPAVYASMWNKLVSSFQPAG